MNEDVFAELAAGHALNALSDRDERDYAEALLSHPEWKAIVAADSATAAALARGVAQIAPPLTARGMLLSVVARTTQHPIESTGLPAAEASHQLASQAPLPGDTETTAPPAEAPSTDVVQTIARRTWTRGLFALAASLALLVTLGFGAALIGGQIGRSPAVIALQSIQDAPDARIAGVVIDDDGQATAHWSESLGQAVLVTDGLPRLPSGETYQLWFIRADETVSAGLLTTDRVGDTTAILDGTVQSGDTIAVSVEPAGGSAQPTTTPIITIPTTA